MLVITSLISRVNCSGIGKRTVVKMAAELLGMHVVEVNCFDLLGATEHKTANAISDAFETARR